MSDITPVTDVGTWKKNSGALGEPMTLPSGNVARVRAPGMQAMLKGGTIPNSLIEIITHQLESAKNNPEKEIDPQEVMNELMTDPTRLNDLLDLIDVVTIAALVEPSVWNVPEEGEPRLDTRLYVDEINIEDKFFIFGSAVGGTKDLEQFREEFAGNVELAQPLIEAQGTPE